MKIIGFYGYFRQSKLTFCKFDCEDPNYREFSISWAILEFFFESSGYILGETSSQRGSIVQQTSTNQMYVRFPPLRAPGMLHQYAFFNKNLWSHYEEGNSLDLIYLGNLIL